MKVVFLNLCHTDPDVVARTAKKLTSNSNFFMIIHVDKKVDEESFKEKLKDNPNVFFTKDRYDVSWGSYSAIDATFALIKEALNLEMDFDRYVLLQNLDYPLKSNKEIEEYFIKYKDKEMIRACNIGKSKDYHFRLKYKMYHDYEDPFYKTDKSYPKKIVHGVKKIFNSIPVCMFNGVIKEKDGDYPLYYGTAQWALTDKCVRYIVDFNKNHSIFNEKMKHIQFPDEEYFHTIVHNSIFKNRCIVHDEPEQRWLVNWRNIHYFEYPGTITVFEEKDFDKLIAREELFCRKVRSGISDKLMDKIDEYHKITT